jgi:hypothetical protein
MGKIVGEPYRGKPDVRFDEGAKGKRPTGNPPLATVNTYLFQSPHGCSTLLGLKDKRIHFKKYNKKIL